MKNSNIKAICLSGLFIAIVCVSTLFIKIPTPATEGYIHFGDGFIIIISVLFGKKYGAVAGGVGSALADVFAGSAHWALFTLIIKGFMGFAAGSIKDYSDENSKFFSPKNIVAAFAAEIIMVAGYFICAILLKGYFMTPDIEDLTIISRFDFGVIKALASLPSNLVQAIGGILIFDVLGFALHNAKLFKLVK